MTRRGKMTLEMTWHAPSSLVITGVDEGGWPMDPVAFAPFALFWHSPSFYGTFYEVEDLGLQTGIALSARAALLYLADDCLMGEQVELGDTFMRLRTLAPRIVAAIQAGRCVPDRSLGFRLLDKFPDMQDLTWIPTWIGAAIAETMVTDVQAQTTWLRLRERHPALGVDETLSGQGATANDGAGVQVFAYSEDLSDDEDWQIAIGLRRDETPFRTCVQLQEPEAGEEDVWFLNLVLQDMQLPEQIIAWESHDVALCTPPVGIPSEWEPHLPRVTRDVARVLRIVPVLEEPEEPGTLRTELDGDEAWEFLDDWSLRLARAGITLFLPSWWEAVRTVKFRLRAKVKSSVGTPGQPLFGMNAALEFDWRVAIGATEMSDAEFQDLLTQKRRLIRFRDQYIQVDPAFLERARKSQKGWEKRHGLTLRDVFAAQALGEITLPGVTEDEVEPIEIAPNPYIDRVLGRLMHNEMLPSLETPLGFVGQLRPYQSQGYSWLAFLRQFGLGACLADDMGLGKTVQFLAYLLWLKDTGASDAPSLLVCPTSVLGNWERECARFAPGLSIHLHYGSNRLHGDAFVEKVKRVDLVITSYTLTHLDELDLTPVHWDTVCLDEAQNIKNAYTKQATAVRNLSSAQRVVMTGTPVENRLTELWALFDFINPGYLGTLHTFGGHFITSIEKAQDPAKIEQLQRLIRPFLMRRTKRDPAVEADLPEKSEQKVFVALTPEQAVLYETVLHDLFERLDYASPMARRGAILAALTRLKQICDHPAVYLKEVGAGKPPRDRSEKLDRLLEMVEELRAEGDQCLIFSQFVETGKLIVSALEGELGEAALFLHGGTAKIARDEMVETFQRGDGPGVMVLSLKAGGVGLNLTAATHVFHFDRWWNPAVENQATDRAYRIGQHRHVQVHKLIALGTLEERIDKMIESKLSLSEQIIGGGETWLTEMSTSDLRELFALRREWMEG